MVSATACGEVTRRQPLRLAALNTLTAPAWCLSAFPLAYATSGPVSEYMMGRSSKPCGASGPCHRTPVKTFP